MPLAVAPKPPHIATEGAKVRIEDFADRMLGKSVVHTRDTPGFIANRIGSFWMSVAAVEAFRALLKEAQANATSRRLDKVLGHA